MKKGISIDLEDLGTWNEFRRICRSSGLMATRQVGMMIERYVREHAGDNQDQASKLRELIQK
jgi:hypothetical protein